MDIRTPDGLIPVALLEQVEALAAAEHRMASDILREAIEGYLHDRRSILATTGAASNPRIKLTAQEAGARIVSRRKFRLMPEGETIESLVSFGRA